VDSDGIEPEHKTPYLQNICIDVVDMFNDFSERVSRVVQYSPLVVHTHVAQGLFETIDEAQRLLAFVDLLC